MSKNLGGLTWANYHLAARHIFNVREGRRFQEWRLCWCRILKGRLCCLGATLGSGRTYYYKSCQTVIQMNLACGLKIPLVLNALTVTCGQNSNATMKSQRQNIWISPICRWWLVQQEVDIQQQVPRGILCMWLFTARVATNKFNRVQCPSHHMLGHLQCDQEIVGDA